MRDNIREIETLYRVCLRRQKHRLAAERARARAASESSVLDVARQVVALFLALVLVGGVIRFGWFW